MCPVRMIASAATPIRTASAASATSARPGSLMGQPSHRLGRMTTPRGLGPAWGLHGTGRHAAEVAQHVADERLAGGGGRRDLLELDVRAVEALEAEVVMVAGAVGPEPTEGEAVVAQGVDRAVGIDDRLEVQVGVEDVDVLGEQRADLHDRLSGKLVVPAADGDHRGGRLAVMGHADASAAA